MRRDLDWTSTLTRIAKQGALTYNDLKRLPIDEFFLVYTDYVNSIRDA